MAFGRLTPNLKIPDVTTFGAPGTAGSETALATLADGRMVAVYSGLEYNHYDVRYQFLSPEGFPIGSSISIAGAPLKAAQAVYVVATADGGFAVTMGATVQRFDASGAATLAPFQQAVFGAPYGSEMATFGYDLVVGTAGGQNILVTRYGPNDAIAAQNSFDVHGYSGSAYPSDIQIATYQGATAASTRIVVAWTQHSSSPGYLIRSDSSDQLGLRVLDGNLNPVSVVLDADTQTPGTYVDKAQSSKPDVTFLKDGSFVLSWVGQGILARHYTADGATISITKVATAGTEPAIHATPDGGYTVAWSNAGVGHIAQYDAHDQVVSPDFSFTLASANGSTSAYPILSTTQLQDGSIAVVDNLNLQIFAQNQTITNGNNANNVISGTAGNDVISGLTGNDTIDGNAGRDVLNGNEGDDVLRGGAGSDVLSGGAGNDAIDGGDGFDVIALDKPTSSYFVETTATGFNLWDGTDKDSVTNVEGFYAVDGKTYSVADIQKASFNALAYIASYKDLSDSLGDDALAGYLHYVQHGKAEGRAPHFDAIAYLAANPDLALAYGDDTIAGARHYIDHGRFENRPTAGFNALEYGASSPDLARQFGTDAAALTTHYLQFGAREGRPLASFDPLEYAASNLDLAKTYGSNATALLNQYLTSGALDGRPTTGFDPLIYAASYDDLARYFGTDAHGALLHYLDHGIGEGRYASGFDSVAYLLSYSDLAGIGPQQALLHWLNNGADEGRIGDALFGREQGGAHDFVNYDAKAALEIASDHDWFQIGMIAGYGADIHLGGVSSGKGTLTDGWLQFYDQSGKLLAVSHGAAGQSDADLIFTPDTSGIYYVVVAGETDHETGTYDLSVTGLPYAAPHIEMAHADYLG